MLPTDQMLSTLPTLPALARLPMLPALANEAMLPADAKLAIEPALANEAMLPAECSEASESSSLPARSGSVTGPAWRSTGALTITVCRQRHSTVAAQPRARPRRAPSPLSPSGASLRPAPSADPGDDGRMAPDHLVFLRRAIRRPDLLATPFVTGDRLAGQLAHVVPDGCRGTVVELGAGTGALSGPIRDRLGSGARHLAVEVDGDLVTHLREHKPWLEVVQGDALDYDALLASAGIDKVDAVVSSLPWALFGTDQRRRLVASIAGRLAPAGVFATITTWVAMPQRVRELRAALDDAFDEVVETATVWRNPPPARLFVCRRPY